MRRRDRPARSGARVALLLALASMVVVLAGPGGHPGADGPASAGSDTPDCQRDMWRPRVSYPITGYFVYPSPDRCETRDTVRSVRAHGGDTVITFGPRLTPREVDATGRVVAANGAVDQNFVDCMDEGRPCAATAARVADPAEIREVYTYRYTERFGAQMLRCAETGLDRVVTAHGHRYLRLLLPVDEPAGSCATDADAYDLVLVSTGNVDGADAIGNLLDEAAAADIDTYVGLPAPPADQSASWVPDLDHLDAVEAFTGRVLDDYAARHGGQGAFAGVYQTLEMPLQDTPIWRRVLDVYAIQHQLVAATLPRREILVSPYLDARREPPGFDQTQVAGAFEAIADTRRGAPMVIAPQDSRGTGKVGTYFPDEAAAPVDPRSAEVVGDRTHEEAYFGTTGDYLEEAARARDATPGVELWMNLEAFSPARLPGEPACSTEEPELGRTTKDRVDKQLAVAGNHASKVVSFMWDSYLPCRAGDAPSLADQITAGADEPIITAATPQRRDGQAGLRITGYELADAVVTLRYRGHGQTPRTTVVSVATDGQYEPFLGRLEPRLPTRLEAVWVPFAPESLDPDAPYVRIGIETPSGGLSFEEFVVDWTADR